MESVYDLFLSHNSEDKPAVREVSNRLKRRRLKPWLDVENLTPGRHWQDEAEEVIRTCRAAAIFVGQSGIGPWEHEEISRDGETRSTVVEGLKARTVKGIICNEVEVTAHIMTDQMQSYHGLGREFASHGTVDHSAGEYVRGVIHVNFS